MSRTREMIQSNIRFGSWMGAIIIAFWMSACSDGPDPQAIVDRAIEVHGGANVNDVVIDFDFREYHYTFLLDDGYYRFQRARDDSAGFLRDVLDNDGFFREIAGVRVDLPLERVRAYSSSINSVAYFLLLPFKLNDAAVQKTYLGATTIEGQPYHEIEVTFAEEGGGRDHQDRFIFWFHRERDTMDYFAYDYASDGGGTRFRKAINPRDIGGIRFLDYENYTSDTIDRPGEAIENMETEFLAEKLKRVSLIQLNNVTVQSIDE